MALASIVALTATTTAIRFPPAVRCRPPRACLRAGKWRLVSTSELLPSDLVSLKRQPGAEPTTVPADCLLLTAAAWAHRRARRLCVSRYTHRGRPLAARAAVDEGGLDAVRARVAGC